MELHDSILYWIGFGALLIIAEAIIPGGIVIFLGISSLLVAASIALGFVSSWPVAITLWFILSIILLMALRGIVQKMVGGESRVDSTDEELDLYGKVAEVVSEIGPGQTPGRVKYQDSTWSALADGSVIPVGEQVRIICHENISLIVERSSDPDLLNSQQLKEDAQC